MSRPPSKFGRFGRLDVAVANAGVNLGVYDLPDEPFDVYERTVAVNQARGCGGRVARPRARLVGQGTGGRIIVIASIASLVGTLRASRTTSRKAR